MGDCLSVAIEGMRSSQIEDSLRSSEIIFRSSLVAVSKV